MTRTVARSPCIRLRISCDGGIAVYKDGQRADDVSLDGSTYQVISAPEALTGVREAVEGAGFTVESAELTVLLHEFRVQIDEYLRDVRDGPRSLEELVYYLGRDNPIPAGTLLLTGTGLVPPDDVALAPGHSVAIRIANAIRVRSRWRR